MKKTVVACLFLISLLVTSQTKAQTRFAFGYAVDEQHKALYITDVLPIEAFRDSRYPSPINHFYYMVKNQFKNANYAITIAWNAVSSNAIAYDPYQAYTREQAAAALDKFLRYYKNNGYTSTLLTF